MTSRRNRENRGSAHPSGLFDFYGLPVFDGLDDRTGYLDLGLSGLPAGLEAGIYDVKAEDDENNTDSAKFTVIVPAPEPTPEPAPEPKPEPAPAPSATSGSLSPKSTGAIGADIIISGTGFTGGNKVTISYDGKEVATATATTEGILIAAFKVPGSCP